MVEAKSAERRSLFSVLPFQTKTDDHQSLETRNGQDFRACQSPYRATHYGKTGSDPSMTESLVVFLIFPLTPKS